MRKAGIVMGIVVAIIIVAVLVFWATFDVNHYRIPIQTQLETRLGRSVNLGAMQLALFPPRFQVDSLLVAEDPAFENPQPFIQAEQVGISVNLFPLLRGGIEVRSLDLRQPVIELIKNEQGVWNFSSLGRPSVDETVKEPPRRTPRFSLASLSVTGGQVALTDRQEGKERAVYSDINARLRDLAPNREFSVQLAVHFPGEGSQEARLEGTGGPLWQDGPAAIPFQGTLDLDAVSLAGLRQFLNVPVLTQVDGTVTGKTRIDVQGGTAAAEGEVSVRDARVNDVGLGYPITAQYAINQDLNSETLTISKGMLQLGSSLLSIDGVVDLNRNPAELNLKVKSDSVSLTEVSRLAPAFGMSSSPGTTIEGLAGANIQLSGTAQKPALNGVFSARDIHVSGADIPQPVEIQSVEFTLTPNQIESNAFNLQSGSTTVRSRVAVREYASEASLVDARFDAPAAQFSAILAMAKAYGLTALDNVTGDGTLSLNMRLSGPVQSLRGDSVLRALGGESEVNFTEVRLTGTDLSRDVASIAGFLRPAGANLGFTSISTMTGKITVRNGIAQTDDLRATLDFGTIGVTGSADLVTHALNLRVNAVVSENVSQQVGGTGIQGYLKTALANNQGELVVPVLVTGTFQAPQVSPDVRSFARMRLEGMLPSSSNPAAGLTGLVGDLLRRRGAGQEQEPQTQEQQPNSEQNPIQQILEALSGKERQQPDPETPSE
jgi:hypothetical protein